MRSSEADLLKLISDVVVLAGWFADEGASVFFHFLAVLPGVLARKRSDLERAPRQYTETEFLRHGNELTLHRALQQQILGLKRDERCPTSEVRNQLCLSDLPRRSVGKAEVANLPDLTRSSKALIAS